jgi:sulfur-oxidizing protein SoxZ
MASGTIKLKAKSKDGVAEVKALISHPMDLARKDKATGAMVPGHYIEDLVAEVNGKPVLSAALSGGISKNPYVSVKVKANPGDTIKMAWKDNKGDSDSVEAKVD